MIVTRMYSGCFLQVKFIRDGSPDAPDGNSEKLIIEITTDGGNDLAINGKDEVNRLCFDVTGANEIAELLEAFAREAK